MATDNISGYCLLSMPSDQVQPLGLLSFQGKGIANSTGVAVGDIFIKSEIALPLISQDYNLSTTMSKSVAIEIAVDTHLSLLEGLLNFMKISASFKLKKSRSVRLNMFDAKKNMVNEFKLDAYINSAQINRISPAFTDMLLNNELYVITDILKCRKYSIEYTNNTKTDTALKAAVPAMAEGGLSVQTGRADSDRAIYEGGDFITIGIKAYRIFYVKDDRTGEESFRIRLDDTIKTVKDDEDFPGEVLNADTVAMSS